MLNVVLKISVPKQKKVRNKTVSKDINAKCIILPDGTYKAFILEDALDIKAGSLIEFTEDSYDLKDCRIVFTKYKDEAGKVMQIIRTKNQAKYSPGLKEHYIPFHKNWIMKGRVINTDGEYQFRFKRLIGIGNYKVDKTYFNNDDE